MGALLYMISGVVTANWYNWLPVFHRRTSKHSASDREGAPSSSLFLHTLTVGSGTAISKLAPVASTRCITGRGGEDNAAFRERGPYESFQVIHLLPELHFRVLMVLTQLAHLVR